MTTLARHFAARPIRTSIGAWSAARDVLCHASPHAAQEFTKVQGVAASIISADLPAEHPFVFAGGGPRIRLYFEYDERALDPGNLNETAPVGDPFSGRWTGLVPCLQDDLELVTRQLEIASTRFAAYDVHRALPDPSDNRAPTTITLDEEALRRL